MSYKITWEEHGLKVVFENVLDNSDYLSCNKDIISDPRFNNLHYILRDYLNVTKFTIDSAAVQTVATLDAAKYQSNPDIKIAIVSDKIVTKGLLNMFLLYFESEVKGTIWQTELFENEAAAREWISQV